MKIFIVNGIGSSGKSSFEQYVQEVTKDRTVIITSIIDYVKDIATCAGWDGGKTMADRKFLSNLKDILTEWNDSPMQEIINQVEDIRVHEGDDSIVFIDMREPDDIDRFIANSKDEVSTILVRRTEKEGTSYGNHADDNVFNYNYDIVIENNKDLLDLRSAAVTFSAKYC